MDYSRCSFLTHLDKATSNLGGTISSFSSKSSTFFGKFQVHFATVLVQVLYAGYQVLASAALSDGVSRYVFAVYRNAIAALLVSPIAYFLEKRKRPSLTLSKLCQFFFCGLIGVCINQTLFLAGLYYTSATFAATVQNLTPAITFILAASLGMETIRIRSREGQAKALGILVCVVGATVIALYKGPSVVTVQGSRIERVATARQGVELSSVQDFESWQLGSLCLLGNCATWAIWFVIQTPVMRNYPAQISVIAFTYTFGAIQLAIVALCIERSLSIWAVTFESDLAAVLYGGIVTSGVGMTLQGWCAHRGGPVLVAAYQPLQTILVAILSSIFLGETFYLGSLLGGFFIIVGLYLVVWGKSKERTLAAMADSMKASDQEYVRNGTTETDATLTEPLLVSHELP